MKVILGNARIIAAFKSGIPDNGKPFPEGSKIAKPQWQPQKSTEATFAVDVPERLADLFFTEKYNKRFAASGGWGDAQLRSWSPAANRTFPKCSNECAKF